MLGRVSAFSFVMSLMSLVDVSAAKAQSLADCGRIHIEAEAMCEVQGGVTCEAMCTPVSVRAACAGKLTASCDAKCTDLPSLECKGSCEADCTGKCAVDPGKFDCTGSCQLDCSGTCSSRCEASQNRAQCAASCEATCGASCQGKCEVQAPEASCDIKCEASCEGSCEGDANIDCQVDCQSEFYADCEVDLEGGCEVACDAEDGALFCDGQYVDHGDHLDQCVAALEAIIDANVEGYADGSSSCGGGSCQAEGEAGASCSVQRSSHNSSAAWWAMIGLAGVAVTRRRPQRARTACSSLLARTDHRASKKNRARNY